MQEPLFESERISEEPLPERIGAMLRIYGPGPEGRTCATCARLGVRAYRKRRYYKCGLNRDTHGPGTDWRLRWPACGCYEPRVPRGEM